MAYSETFSDVSLLNNELEKIENLNLSDSEVNMEEMNTSAGTQNNVTMGDILTPSASLSISPELLYEGGKARKNFMLDDSLASSPRRRRRRSSSRKSSRKSSGN